jgi:hypothetical protein
MEAEIKFYHLEETNAKSNARFDFSSKKDEALHAPDRDRPLV